MRGAKGDRLTDAAIVAGRICGILYYFFLSTIYEGFIPKYQTDVISLSISGMGRMI